MPLDGVDLSDFNGVALSIELLGWGRKFSYFEGKVEIQNGKILGYKFRKLLFIKFNNKLALTALHSAAWYHVDKVDALRESDLVGIAKITFSKKWIRRGL